MSDQFHRFQSMKILAHADRLDQVVRGETPYPLDWHIFPSNICNHSCTWCLARGIMIDTPNGLIAIEKLGIGDQVYGPSGKVNTISGVSSRFVEEVYEITINHRHTIVCSGEHPILTERGWKDARDCFPGERAVVRVRMRSGVRMEQTTQAMGEVHSWTQTFDKGNETQSKNYQSKSNSGQGGRAAVMQVRVWDTRQEVPQMVDGLLQRAPAARWTENRGGAICLVSQDDYQQPDVQKSDRYESGEGEAWKAHQTDARGGQEHSGSIQETDVIRSQPHEECRKPQERANKNNWVFEEVENRGDNGGVVYRTRPTDSAYGIGYRRILGRSEGAGLQNPRTEKDYRNNTKGSIQYSFRAPNTGELCLAPDSTLSEVRMGLPRDILQRQGDTADRVTSGAAGLYFNGIALERGLALQPITHIRRIRERTDVYNFSCDPEHAYEANGVVVHNCMYRQPAPDGHIEQLDAATRVMLPRPLLLRGIEDAARTGAVLIHFSGGGEPLLNKATLEAMRLAQALASTRERGIRNQLKVALSTNGRLLTPEVAEQVDYIRVSLNAGTPEQHTHTNHAGKGPGDWDVILGNIREAVRAKRGDLGLGFVVDHENYRDILPFCEAAVDLGVDFVHIRPAFYYEKEKDQAVRECMPEAFKICDLAKWRHRGTALKIFAIAEKFEGYWTPRTYRACRAVWTGVCLRATGDFAVCQDRTDLTFGHDPNYKAGATFEGVWHSAEHQAVVARIHDGEGGELSKCPRCVWGGRNLTLLALERDDLRIALV